MKQMGLAAALSASVSVAAAVTAVQAAGRVAPVESSGQKKEVTITGCVVKGDGGYVLTNVASETEAAALAAGAPSTPQPPGAVLPARVLYWVDDDDDLEDHAGHKVEVRGELEGEVEKGTISAEREGGVVELEFKVDGKKVAIKVPDVPPAIGTSGKVGDKEVDFPYVVRRIDVKSVKTITSTCQ